MLLDFLTGKQTQEEKEGREEKDHTFHRYLDSASGSVSLAYYLDYYWTREATTPFVLNTVGNHDFFISRKAFFFDLSPWADEAPNDDPQQPLGTDQAALKAIFLAAYKAAAGGFIHLGIVTN